MTWISPDQLKKLLDNGTACLVDVREPYEREICQIPALFVPMAEVKNRHTELPTEKDIVVMCRSGKRAEAVAHMLEDELGYSKIHVLEGGILNWIEKIDPSLEIY